MKLLKKLLSGGNNDMDYNRKLQYFISIVIIGYFGIKIVYGVFFNFYPLKYYNRNIQITTNDNINDNNGNTLTENITLNAYVPGLWNNEMGDIITVIVIVFVIYVFTNSMINCIYNEYGNLNIAFLMGYVLGLGYPAIRMMNTNKDSSVTDLSYITTSNYMVITGAIILMIIIIIVNYIEATKKGMGQNYAIYSVAVVVLIGGLILTRKQLENYSKVSYYKNDGDNCSFVKNGVLQTSGDIINITGPFISFVLILLFTYEPANVAFKSLYIIIYGILLGIIVSGISYFGMEYFLIKVPEKECNNMQDCVMKKMTTPVDEKVLNDEINIPDLTITKDLSKISNKMNILKIFLITFVILLAVYLIYYYIIS